VDDETSRKLRIGRRIALARKERGLTQRDCAELIGITVRSLQHYEAGNIVPYRHFHRMERLLRKRPGWFLEDESERYASMEALSELRGQLTDHLALLEDRLLMLSENVERLRGLRTSNESRRSRRLGPDGPFTELPDTADGDAERGRSGLAQAHR
jgi:transcriptional regulator with XRE-family HTH domain